MENKKNRIIIKYDPESSYEVDFVDFVKQILEKNSKRKEIDGKRR